MKRWLRHLWGRHRYLWVLGLVLVVLMLGVVGGLNGFRLSDDSALLLATEEWLTSSGRTIWHQGISPEVVVSLPADVAPLLPEAECGMTPAQLQASGDEQLLRALDLLVRSAGKQGFTWKEGVMIEKRLSAKPGKVLVTFRISQDVWADHITLVGDFNDWNEASHPLIQTRSDPDWHITIELDTGRCYQIRYLCDGQEWNSDDHADDYAPNPYGEMNFVVDTGMTRIHKAKEVLYVSRGGAYQPTVTERAG